MSPLHSRSRRPPPLEDVDYDHEIFLIETESEAAVAPSHSDSPDRGPDAIARAETTESQRSDALLRKQTNPPESLTQGKLAKFKRRSKSSVTQQVAQDGTAASASVPPGVRDDISLLLPDDTRGRSRRSVTAASQHKKGRKLEWAVDVLYENQRGGFFCGIPLFSSKALGAADAPPWTNIAHKPSATDITTAQTPDPSWVWEWKEWKVYHSDLVDKDGWEYSFMFSKKFSWHGPKWYSSYVRRRAWIRKRVRKEVNKNVNEAHMLSPEYFTIHSHRARSLSTSRAGSTEHRYDALVRRELEEAMDLKEIRDIGHLMKALKHCRIDREKIEAVESFVEHADDDIYYLRERMGDVMHQFIFQASRHILLSNLSQWLDERGEQTNGIEGSGAPSQRRDWLEAAVKAADEAVKRLQYWSDIKDLAEQGETRGAVDRSQGWDQSWVGLDNSGPKDVISDRELLNEKGQADRESNGEDHSDGGVQRDIGKEIPQI